MAKSEMEQAADQGIHLFKERGQVFWEMFDEGLGSVVFAAHDHNKLSKYFLESLNEEIREGSLADNVIRLLDELKELRLLRERVNKEDQKDELNRSW